MSITRQRSGRKLQFKIIYKCLINHVTEISSIFTIQNRKTLDITGTCNRVNVGTSNLRDDVHPQNKMLENTNRVVK